MPSLLPPPDPGDPPRPASWTDPLGARSWTRYDDEGRVIAGALGPVPLADDTPPEVPPDEPHIVE